MSPNAHINLHTLKNADGFKGKMVDVQPCPLKLCVFVYMKIWETNRTIENVENDLDQIYFYYTWQLKLLAIL